MPDVTPAPHFLNPNSTDPFEAEAAVVLNEQLKAELATGGTDAGFYMRLLKRAMIDLATSPGMELAGMIDPMFVPLIHAALIAGGGLERTLVNRDLTPMPDGCGNPDCPNCGCNPEEESDA